MPTQQPSPTPLVMLSPSPAPTPMATIATTAAPSRSEDAEIADSFFGTMGGALIARVVAIAFILIARTIQAMLLHTTLRKAIESQSPHAADLIGKLNQPAANVRRIRQFNDDRNGIVLAAIGLAMAGYGVINAEHEAIGAALFPLLVGLGLLLRHRMVTRAERDMSAE